MSTRGRKTRKLKVYYNMVNIAGDPIEDLDVTTKSYVDGKIVVGDVKYSVRNTDHNGWLYCDGRSISRDDYAELFSIIGTSFGSSSGSTFNLPNCKGRVLGAVGTGSGLTTRTLGDATGAETHTMTTNQMPSHTHTGTSASSGAHTHTGTSDSSGTHTHTINDPGHTHTQTTTNDDYNNSGGNPPGFTGDSAGTVTWNNINSNTTGISINSSGAHTHTFTTDSSGAHTHTFTTDATGSGQSFNIMQPTIFMGNVFIFSGI